ncbi:MAG: rhodanese-like domain-containing protein [Pseudomonadota bacterium]
MASPAHSQSCGTTHTVQPGESLSILAQKTLGSIQKFRLIHRANVGLLGSDPNNLEVGMDVYLPCEGEQVVRNWAPLVDAATLAELMRGPVQVVDLRDEAELIGGVVPGALSVPYARWQIADEIGSPAYDRTLSRVIGDAGMKIDEPVVLVTGTAEPIDAGRAAYVYWVLKSAGVAQVAILHGGQEAWFNAGHQLAPEPRRALGSRLSVSTVDNWHAEDAEIEAISGGSIPGMLLDVRAKSDAVSGVANADTDALHRLMLREASGQDSVFAALGWAKEQRVNWESEPVVGFSETGELAALNWFYLSEVAQIRNVKFYPKALDSSKIAAEKFALAQ